MLYAHTNIKAKKQFPNMNSLVRKTSEHKQSGNWGSTDYLLLLQIFNGVVSPSVMQHIVSVESSSLLLHSYLT